MAMNDSLVVVKWKSGRWYGGLRWITEVMWVRSQDGGDGGVYASFMEVVMEAVNDDGDQGCYGVTVVIVAELEGGGSGVTMAMETEVSFTKNGGELHGGTYDS
ncbi:hypothetical protein L1987_43032 [Smallanthus sonchifolius]|uniref:Uncharacterized protein n=1 Tax=Smallanthus sonchifolius TaxID=185202 RepID=A0ACB9GLR8_9ASTR|nr:hypothetical protein L1987_43032 [Smallanthus sonchifolius]